MKEFNTGFAETEGWTISYTGKSDGREYELQKLVGVDVFTDDARAWEFVTEKAVKGSLYHIEALEFLKCCAEVEYNEIIKFTTSSVDSSDVRHSATHNTY